LTRRRVSSDDAPPPAGPYSQGIKAGDFLFLAGQAPLDRDGNVVRGSVADQTRQALSNLDAVARSAGGSLARAVRVGVYLSNLDHFAEMNAAYEAFFEEPLPARTTIQSDFTRFDVEIDAVVWLGD
jgi:2-iminobutanoate/2-iminopropanoate deaminase